jgi:hypothetical protein
MRRVLSEQTIPCLHNVAYTTLRSPLFQGEEKSAVFLRFVHIKYLTPHRSSIGIGFSSKSVPLSRLPGWEPESWAYHGDDGHSFCCQSSGKHYGPPFTAGDIIGCGVNFRTGSAFFTKNGDHLGEL